MTLHSPLHLYLYLYLPLYLFGACEVWVLVVVAPDGSSGAFLVIDWPQVWSALGDHLHGSNDYINMNRESLLDRIPYQVINTEKTLIDPRFGLDLGTIFKAPI